MEDLLSVFITLGMYGIVPVLIILKRLHTRRLSKTFKEFVEDISTWHAHANERTTWYGLAHGQAQNAWFYFYLNAQRKQIGQFYYIYGHHSAPIKDFPPLDMKEFGRCTPGFAMRVVERPDDPSPAVAIAGEPEEVLRTLLHAPLLEALEALLSRRRSAEELLLELSVAPSALMLRLDLQHVKALEQQLNELIELLPKLYAIHEGFKAQPHNAPLDPELLQAALLDERYARCHKDIQIVLARRDPTKLPAALQELLSGGAQAPLHVRMGHAWAHPERYEHDEELLRWLAAQAGPHDPHDTALTLTTPSERVYPIEHIHQLLDHISVRFVATATGIVPHHLQAKTLKRLSKTLTEEELEETLLTAFERCPDIPVVFWTHLVHNALIEHRELLISSLLKHELRCVHEHNLNLLTGAGPLLTPAHEPLLLELLERSAQWRAPLILDHIANVGTGLSYTTLSQSALMSTHPKQTQKALNAILRRHKQLEHEHVGGLSLSASGDEQHGALSLSQDAGGLAMVEPREDEEHA